MSQNTSRWTAFLRGLRCRCPACGEGRMFGKYLKVVPACAACGEELHHHHADDFPPYIVISIVGHLVLSLALVIELSFSPPMWVTISFLIALGSVLTLALLQPVKGAVVAIQWGMGLDGFRARWQRRAVNARHP
jgi:uncharacterized protein (DUF983 family)